MKKHFLNLNKEKKSFPSQANKSMVDQKLSEFNSNYLGTRNERLDLDTKIREIEKNFKSSRSLANVRSLIDNQAIDTVYTQVKTLEIEYANLSKVYKISRYFLLCPSPIKLLNTDQNHEFI